MGGSIHIHGTGSSIVDTVFVCRQRGTIPRAWFFENAAGLCIIMKKELIELRAAGMKPTSGDIRCMVLGHITRMAIWRLRSTWDLEIPIHQKLTVFRSAMDALAIEKDVTEQLQSASETKSNLFAGQREGKLADAIAF
jgi:hypothetical protein